MWKMLLNYYQNSEINGEIQIYINFFQRKNHANNKDISKEMPIIA